MNNKTHQEKRQGDYVQLEEKSKIFAQERKKKTQERKKLCTAQEIYTRAKKNGEKGGGFRLGRRFKLGPTRFTPATRGDKILAFKICSPFYLFVTLDEVDTCLTYAPLKVEPRVATSGMKVARHCVAYE